MSLSICPAVITSEEENYQTEKDVPMETGYLGDVDTSSSGDLETESSDSDDISVKLKKGNLLKSKLSLVPNFCVCSKR